MIDFMVLGLPRSGTAWMANLLTTDTSLCLHEPLIENSLEQLDSFDYKFKLGISDTSAGFFAQKINNHPAKKVIINRTLDDMNFSLINLGFPTMTKKALEMLNAIDGYRINFDDLFEYKKIAFVYEFLIDKTLDKKRYDLLCKMNVQNTNAIHNVRKMI